MQKTLSTIPNLFYVSTKPLSLTSHYTDSFVLTTIDYSPVIIIKLCRNETEKTDQRYCELLNHINNLLEIVYTL